MERSYETILSGIALLSAKDSKNLRDEGVLTNYEVTFIKKLR